MSRQVTPHGSPEPPLPETPERQAVRARLLQHLTYLSVTLGERSIYRPKNLRAAEDYVFRAFQELGYPVSRQVFLCHKQEVANVIAGMVKPAGYYILGAHFDTVAGSPGADDNASGVAVMLEVARLVKDIPLPRPWVFIGFTTEEPPVFGSLYMGSDIYARRARREGHRILGMLCLESVGYFRPEPDTQVIPLPLKFLGYPTTGNFLGLISDRRSKALMERLKAALTAEGTLPVETLAVPLGGYLVPETRLSDHANFWDQGYPAVMLTDTAFLRNPNYHTERDRLETLDLTAMVELTLGLARFLRQEAG
jgi:Zn-dependent M28 family amino/carboxypeptidase